MRRLTSRQRTAAIVLAVLALCFITLDVGGGSLRASHSGVRGTLGALYRGTDAMLGPVRRFVEGVPTAGTNKGTISRLEHENAQLRGRLAADRAARTDQHQLSALQAAAGSGGYRVLPARVTALGSADGFDWTATLNVGTQNGVRKGQSVTDGYGLVGRVLHADRSSSVVLLSADPGSGVGARDARNGEVGLATGRGAAGFTFVPLNPKAALRAGDKLVTGPSSATSFVPGLSIGTVTGVHASTDGTTTATVRPTTSPSSLDLVGVIVLDSAGSTNAAGGSR
ncbi:MAG TPA: rod shape-determining protein MreC [Jatrophihabitantaceae bacterium]|nr:rod shape-determining protein MreC [Jatrophihabitantaceae bacterium]